MGVDVELLGSEDVRRYRVVAMVGKRHCDHCFGLE